MFSISHMTRRARIVGFAVTAVAGIVLLFQLSRRVWFIVSNRGLDVAEPAGSPMVFLIGTVIELALFVLTLLVLHALRKPLHNGASRTNVPGKRISE